ncbi:ANTAR domain-containing protein [Streptomyces fodineus]|uniref:ANTAR domain-containing protein n=1 Tax=Streptomyces fodineus TaxID=1904616 RepID=UPI000B078A1B|nr:ANTAR domain-containing protein [Streptomyces fodineus]
MMENSRNGTLTRLEEHLVPGRTLLLNKISELQTEISQLQEAVVSHTVVDQAIGVVITLGGLRPEQGFQALREVSQHTNYETAAGIRTDRGLGTRRTAAGRDPHRSEQGTGRSTVI